MSQHIDILNETRRTTGPGPDVTEAIQGIPREVPANIRNFGYIAMTLGLLAFLGGMATDSHRTGGVLLTCIVYFFGVSQGGVMFATISTLTLGRWQRPFKRIAESFASFLPVVYVLWVLFLLGGGLNEYEWYHEPFEEGHKAIWLSPGFFVARQVVAMGFLTLLSMIFVRNSLRPDMGVAAEQLGASRAPAWWGRITLGWKGRAAEVEEAYQRNMKLAPIMVVSYFLIFSMFAIDAVMSLAPHWFANMFPAWICVSSVWMTLSWICILSVVFKKWLGIDHLIGKSNYHDLGKLMFALCVFWTYNFFAQLLPIWYGNMPEETGYLMLRLFAHPWSSLGKVVGAMCFLIPFTVLLSRGIKKIPSALATVGCVIVTGVFLERFLLVMPQVWEKDSLPIGPVEVGVFIGFIGAFVTVVSNFLARVPPVVATDPFMHPNPFDVHVHVGHDHDHSHAH